MVLHLVVSIVSNFLLLDGKCYFRRWISGWRNEWTSLDGRFVTPVTVVADPTARDDYNIHVFGIDTGRPNVRVLKIKLLTNNQMEYANIEQSNGSTVLQDQLPWVRRARRRPHGRSLLDIGKD